jgi:hypothetical protein
MTHRDIIDDLIDVSGVPECKRHGEKYEQARESIHKDLATPEDVEAACYHEAGHWYEAVAASDYLGIDSSEITVHGPRIKYDSKTDEYDVANAGIQAKELKSFKAQSEEDVKAMARIVVAGGVTVRHFDKSKPGDKDDKPRFEAFARDARNRLGGIIDPPHEYWDDATDGIEKQFQDSDYRNAVKSKAEEIKNSLFARVFQASNLKSQ